ncbi:3379_t:CDS:2, partial [Racocetra fulgida]
MSSPTPKVNHVKIYPWSQKKLNKFNPFPRNGHSVSDHVISNELFIFGGFVNEKATNELFVADVSKHGAALVADVLYIFGGRTQDGDVLGDLIALRLTTSPRYDPSMVVVDQDKIFVFGGESDGTIRPDADGNIHILDTCEFNSNSQTPKQQTVHRKQLSITPPLKASVQPKEQSIMEDLEETSSSLKSSNASTHSKRPSLVESSPDLIQSHSISQRSTSLNQSNNQGSLSSQPTTQLFNETSGETLPSSKVESMSQRQPPLPQPMTEVPEKNPSIILKQQSLEITRPLQPKIESHRIHLSQQQRQSYDTFGKAKSKGLGITVPVESANSKSQLLDANFYQHPPVPPPVDSDLNNYEMNTINKYGSPKQSPNINELNPSENETLSLTPLSSSDTSKPSRFMTEQIPANSLETDVLSKTNISENQFTDSYKDDLFKDFDTVNNSVENSKTNNIGNTMLESEQSKNIENKPVYVRHEKENSQSSTKSFMSNNETSTQTQDNIYVARERKEKRPIGARPLVQKQFVQTDIESSTMQNNYINGVNSPISDHIDSSEEIDEDRNTSPLQEDHSDFPTSSTFDINNIVSSKLMLDNALQEEQRVNLTPPNSEISNIVPSNLSDNEVSIPIPTPTTGSTYVSPENDNLDPQTSGDERDTYFKEAIQRDPSVVEFEQREQWFNNELDSAKKLGYNLDLDDDEKMTDELDFEQLSKLLDPKSEKYKIMQSIYHMQQKLKKAKENIANQALIATQKIAAAEQAHEAAIQEAAYYKSKIEGLVNSLDPKYRSSEVERTMKLEKQLTQVLKENIQLQNQYEEYYQKSINENSFQEPIKPH